MSEPFDPLHTWLGIPPAEQPPNHYRLLGIPLFELDPATIDHAADQRMAYLRTLQAGQHAQSAAKLLNQVAAARVCLLNSHRRAAYDRHLDEQLAPPAPPEPAPAAPAPAASPIEKAAGDAFGGYAILERLGGDQQGAVYKARHQAMGRVVALKVLSAWAAENAESVARFLRKANILARLSHPNLVAAYDVGRAEGAYYLAMEYVEGPDLATMLAHQGPLPVHAAAGYVGQAAAGLGFAHHYGVFHRNVKPSNLLVGPGGVVKVIGLGLARVDFAALGQSAFGGEITAAGRVMGTLDYMSPEQSLDSTKVDARSDVYSLGCTLFKLLTGQVMYPVKSKVQKIVAHRGAAIPLLRAARPDASPALEAVYLGMVAKRPEERFQSMDQVIAALAAC